MRSTLFLLLIIVMLCSCKSKKAGSYQNKEPEMQKPEDRNSSSMTNDSSKNKSYTWTPEEQKKFMNDCMHDADDEDLSQEKLSDFCNCMLTQSQKYYPHYHQMNEHGDEDHDAEILDKCAGIYLKQE